MNKKDTLQAELEAIEASKKRNIATIDGINRSLSGKDKRICEIEKMIAEESKPKLRHGDYGTWEGDYGKGKAYLHVQCDDSLSPVSNTECYYGQTSVDDAYAIQGNVFDDLKAMQENVTEFKVKDEDGSTVEFSIRGGQMMIIAEDEDGEIVTYFELSDNVALKLQQMEATMKRNS